MSAEKKERQGRVGNVKKFSKLYMNIYLSKNIHGVWVGVCKITSTQVKIEDFTSVVMQETRGGE